MKKPLHHVAVAIVRRDDRWLVARRPGHVHLGGFWEFPGGKCQSGETAAEAALRELFEECEVRASAVRTLPAVVWEYDDRVVSLTPVLCRWEQGEGRAKAGDACRWVSWTELCSLEMPPLNAQVLAELAKWWEQEHD